MANSYLDTLDPWPLTTPLPDDTIFLVGVPSMGKEFRVDKSQLPSSSQAAVLQVAVPRTDLAAAAESGKLTPGTQYQVTGRGVGKLPVVVAAVSRTQLAAIGTRLESDGSVTAVAYNLASDTDTALAGGSDALTAALLATITQQGSGITLSVVNGKLVISATSQPSPEAPRNPQTDDVSNIFSHSLVTGFPSAADYELEKSAEAAGFSVRSDAYVQNGRVYFPGITGPHAVGTVRSRVVASGSRPAGAPVSNVVAFTGPVVVPVASAPAAVTQLDTTAGNGQVAVTAEPPTNGGSPILSYRYEYRAGTSGTWLVAGTTANTSYTITGLTNGTSYQFRAFATNAVGTSVAGTVVSATPVANGGVPTVYQLQNSQFFNNILNLSRTDYTVRNPYSYTRFTLPTGVSTFDVQVTSNLPTATKYDSLRQVAVRVNGVYQHIPVTNSTGAWYTVNVAAGAIVEVLNGFLEKVPNQDYTGAFVTAVRMVGVPTFAAPAAPAKRVIILGDSIPTGAFATNPAANAAPNLVADELASAGWRVTREMYSGRALADDYAETSDRAGFVSRLVAGLDGTSENVVYIELSTNDGDVQTLANRYGAFVDALHAAKPSARIIAQLTAYRADANGGNNYAAKRTAIANLAGIRPWLQICQASEITAQHLDEDNVHFTDSGHRVLADLMKSAILNPPAPVADSTTILSPQQRQLTPAGTWYADQVPGYVSSQGYASTDLNARDSFTFTGIGFDVNSIRSPAGAPVSVYISPAGANNFQLAATSTQYHDPIDQATIFSIRGLAYGTYDAYIQLTTPATTGLIADQVVVYKSDPTGWENMAFSVLNPDTQVTGSIYSVNKPGGELLGYVSQGSKVLAANAVGGVRMKFDGTRLLGVLCLSTAAGSFGYATANYSCYFRSDPGGFGVSIVTGTRNAAGTSDTAASQVVAVNAYVRLWRGSDMHVRLEYSANGGNWTPLHDYGVYSGALYGAIDPANNAQASGGQVFALNDPEWAGFA